MNSISRISPKNQRAVFVWYRCTLLFLLIVLLFFCYLHGLQLYLWFASPRTCALREGLVNNAELKQYHQKLQQALKIKQSMRRTIADAHATLCRYHDVLMAGNTIGHRIEGITCEHNSIRYRCHIAHAQSVEQLLTTMRGMPGITSVALESINPVSDRNNNQLLCEIVGFLQTK
jgi:hypothetical protein